MLQCSFSTTGLPVFKTASFHANRATLTAIECSGLSMSPVQHDLDLVTLLYRFIDTLASSVENESRTKANTVETSAIKRGPRMGWRRRPCKK